MQIYKLHTINLPTLPANQRVNQTLLTQLNRQKSLYSTKVPASKQEEIVGLLNTLALHISHSTKHPEKYSENLLYFLWFLFCDESTIKEYYVLEVGDFSQFFSSGPQKCKNDSSPQLLKFLKDFYTNNKTLSKIDKVIISLFCEGHDTTVISNTLKVDRVKVTNKITELTKRAIKYLDQYYESNKDDLNEELLSLSSLIWEEEE